MELSEMSREERSLLLFVETQAVDHGGALDRSRVNDADMEVLLDWHEDGFVMCGRLPSALAGPGARRGRGRCATHWVHLSDEAWRLAHEERRARHGRLVLELKGRVAGCEESPVRSKALMALPQGTLV